MVWGPWAVGFAQGEKQGSKEKCVCGGGQTTVSKEDRSTEERRKHAANLLDREGDMSKVQNMHEDVTRKPLFCVISIKTSKPTPRKLRLSFPHKDTT